MDHMVLATINGEDRWLNFSVAVMFDMNDRYGNLEKALNALEGNGKDGFEAVRWFAIQMANDAELCRRDQGYDPHPMLSEADISIRMQPLAYAMLKSAIVEAITQGFQRETSTKGEIDLGLEELRAKKAEAGV